MKNFLFKLSLVCAISVAIMGCNPQKQGGAGVGDFALDLKNVGADYVEIGVTAPAEIEMAYVVSEEPVVLTPAVMFFTGKTIQIAPGETLKLTDYYGGRVVNLGGEEPERIYDHFQQETEYYFYAVARINSQEYSDIKEFHFTTKEYGFTDLLTVVDTYHHGYKIQITVPEETKQRGNVIRYNSASVVYRNIVLNEMFYGDEEAYMLNTIVSNGNIYGNYVKEDTTMLRDDYNTVLLDEYGDPVLDEYGNQIDLHEPVVPGEPTVFAAGECALCTDDELGEILGFSYGYKGELYLLPMYDFAKKEWTGAYQQVVFMNQEPTLCEATVDIEIPEEEISPVDALIYFTMEEGVDSYFYMILDDATYNGIVDVYLDGDESLLRWFLTSYYAAVKLGIQQQKEDIVVNAAAEFTAGALEKEEKYHVICTILGDPEGKSQNFVHKTFTSKPATLLPPEIEIKAVPSDDPYSASFNIKAPNQDVVGAYYAANYAREFELMFNQGYTYETLLTGNNQFTTADIEAMNSPEGLTVDFPTLDGETTRLAVYGCNVEYTFNEIDENNPGQGWCDYRSPMAETEAIIESELYEALSDDWTATATIRINETTGSGNVVSRNLTYSSKVNITSGAPYLPESVEDHVYDIYNGISDKAEVDKMFEELTILSEEFAEYRVQGNNRVLCNGFIDFDYYDDAGGRMLYRSPYDLFQATDYTSYDIPQLIYDFGPKWFMELQSDGTWIVPFSSTLLPPMHAWPGYPFYVGAVGKSESDGSQYAFYDANENYPGFPVTISDDLNTITIHPLSYEDGSKYYMNALGVETAGSSEVTILATVISDIVLTRGYTDTKAVAEPVGVTYPSKVRAVTADGAYVRELPKTKVYKSLTKLEPAPVRNHKLDENPSIVTSEMVDKFTEEVLNDYKNRMK